MKGKLQAVPSSRALTTSGSNNGATSLLGRTQSETTPSQAGTRRSVTFNGPVPSRLGQARQQKNTAAYANGLASETQQAHKDAGNDDLSITARAKSSPCLPSNNDDRDDDDGGMIVLGGGTGTSAVMRGGLMTSRSFRVSHGSWEGHWGNQDPSG